MAWVLHFEILYFFSNKTWLLSFKRFDFFLTKFGFIISKLKFSKWIFFKMKWINLFCLVLKKKQDDFEIFEFLKKNWLNVFEIFELAYKKKYLIFSNKTYLLYFEIFDFSKKTWFLDFDVFLLFFFISLTKLGCFISKKLNFSNKTWLLGLILKY